MKIEIRILYTLVQIPFRIYKTLKWIELAFLIIKIDGNVKGHFLTLPDIDK